MFTTNWGEEKRSFAAGEPRDPVIEGTEGDDHLLGTASGDILIGHGGNDTLAGGGGFDVMTGGPGDDWLHGAAGIDIAIYGGQREDYDTAIVGGTVTVVRDLRDGSPDGFDRLTGTDVVVFGREAYFGSFVPGAQSIAARAQAAPSAFATVNATSSAQSWLVDEQFYLEQNADVAAAVQAGDFANARAHWDAFGRFEGRAPNALFDAEYYLSTNADLSAAFGADGRAALTHWLSYGMAEGRDASPLFDSEAYLKINADVAVSSFTAVEHYLLYGHGEGRAAIVDTTWLGLA